MAAALIASLGLHALTGVFFIQWWKPGGLVAQAPEVISVNLVPSAVFEAVEEQPAQNEEAAASAASDGQQGTPKPEEFKHEEHKENAEAVQSAQSDSKPVDDSNQADAIPEIKDAEVPQEIVTQKKKPEEKPREPKQEAHAKKHLRQAPQRVAAAGQGRATSSGQVSASRGNLVQYANTVRVRIARRMPGEVPHAGTAKIAFSISPSGALAYVRLSQSSGNAALDAAALRAVRAAAPFPPPPGAQRFSSTIPIGAR